MKVLGIVCSPRLQGNTEIMMQESLSGAQEAGAEVELVTVAGKTISPCDACCSCLKTGKCHIEDDMQDLYTKFLEADGIIFGTPVYFWSVCAQAKALIDRTYVFRTGLNLRGKVAGVVVTARRAGASSTFTVFNNFFNLQRMIMAGGAIGFGGWEEEAWAKGGVRNDKTGMAEARGLGRAVVRRIQAR